MEKEKKDEGIRRSIGLLFGGCCHLADCCHEVQLWLFLGIPWEIIKRPFGRIKMSFFFFSLSFSPAILWLLTIIVRNAYIRIFWSSCN